MPTTRVLQGVLCNFLGTYTSRYSDHGGYWLLGLIVDDLVTLDLDLLAEPAIAREGPIRTAHERAVTAFRDQLAKAGLDAARVTSARLRAERGPAATSIVEGTARTGWSFRLVASAETDNGRVYECAKTIFVAVTTRGSSTAARRR